MIHHLNGTITHIQPPLVVIECNGVGYELSIPMTTLYKLPDIGAQVSLFTHLQIREDAHTLFGFIDQQTRSLFRLLIKVNGVGPKLALTILSGMDLAELLDCVQEGNLSRLVKVPGIGKKTAERLLIEMKDKISDLIEHSDQSVVLTRAQTKLNGASDDAISALIALGYKEQDARRAIKEISDVESSEEMIRLALKNMLGR